jgi:hypothetical protein
MNITKQKFGINDIRQAAINNQVHYYGNSLSDIDPKKVYFILSTTGTVTIEDKDNNTEFVLTGNNAFIYPMRMDGGFQASGTNISVIYCYITVTDIAQS